MRCWGITRCSTRSYTWRGHIGRGSPLLQSPSEFPCPKSSNSPHPSAVLKQASSACTWSTRSLEIAGESFIAPAIVVRRGNNDALGVTGGVTRHRADVCILGADQRIRQPEWGLGRLGLTNSDSDTRIKSCNKIIHVSCPLWCWGTLSYHFFSNWITPECTYTSDRYAEKNWKASTCILTSDSCPYKNCCQDGVRCVRYGRISAPHWRKRLG